MGSVQWTRLFSLLVSTCIASPISCVPWICKTMSPFLPLCVPGWPQVYKVVTHFWYASYRLHFQSIAFYYIHFVECETVYYKTSWPQTHYVFKSDLGLPGALFPLHPECRKCVWITMVSSCSAGDQWFQGFAHVSQGSGNWTLSHTALSSLTDYEVTRSSLSSMWGDVHKTCLYPLAHLPAFFSTLFLWNLH